ncbi:Prophage PSPPH06, putative tail sheath protein [Moritella viscosa]|uniref:DUF2586 domain-containing protein n=1 Tax=Moritella viscosa TaxID=80854 RepID=UPI000508ED8E|nr:DUF2586 domain-containing protein [Moritella viscosa]CED59257.1 putative tail sheath protein [Moritella viscosa]CED59975.1 putative uncharacterized phage protein [Moritella viscosa]SGY86565.1 Prophage PSPPH06, putative tail sheath protein [Moritella viscosa]SHO00723.1 Prophage PSPPH06, putative tail sheath protein [Moritella viscosa]SHO15337.1 Prophage PSPPH06, putative tail sheath protein [Moritella viscosa]
MAQGKVSVTSLNTGSGATKEVERAVLFIGVGTLNIGSIVAVNAQSEFDELISADDSALKTQLQAWVRNGDDLVSGWAIPINSGDDVFGLIDNAMDQNISPEIIVITTAITGKSQIEAFQNKALEILAKHARRVRFLVAAPGLVSGQTWSEHLSALTPLTDGVVADRVAVVPGLYGDELGAVTGRLCKRSVTIADSPMRVQTGAMSLQPTPIDNNGQPITNAVTAALDAVRFSCVQFYPDFDGIYFGDVNMLDAEGGDYQQIEAGRIVDKAARQVRIIAIYQIKNRRLNNSPTGISFGKRVLGKPLRAMAKSINIGADKFPGEIREPKDDSISLTFMNERQLRVLLKVQPIDSPSEILVGIMLDKAE